MSVSAHWGSTKALNTPPPPLESPGTGQWIGSVCTHRSVAQFPCPMAWESGPVSEIKPMLVFLENVPKILSKEAMLHPQTTVAPLPPVFITQCLYGRTLSHWVGPALGEQCGYQLRWVVMGANDVGGLHVRAWELTQIRAELPFPNAGSVWPSVAICMTQLSHQMPAGGFGYAKNMGSG